MKIGIIKEGKIPPDSRVPLTPTQCQFLRNENGLDIVAESSPNRCFRDEEYTDLDVPVVTDLQDCDILMGVKEVPVEALIPGQTYFMFSHTIKEQPYNRNLLRAILKKNIRLVDYEVITDDAGFRVIAFGHFAGMVGAHNGLWTYGRRTGLFDLPRMKDCLDYKEVMNTYVTLELPQMKVVLTGTGRVAGGAAKVLDDMGFHKVDPNTFIQVETTRPLYTQLAVTDYAKKKDGTPFTEQDYFDHPTLFESNFSAFANASDIMINGIYWDPRSPAFFTREEMANEDFKIQVIADVTCDIAPASSIPSTLRATTIEDPVFGYDPETGEEAVAFDRNGIDMMTIDNLPNELPRDASQAFGIQFMHHVLPELLKESSPMIERATIADNGKLGKHFQYLEDYVGNDI